MSLFKQALSLAAVVAAAVATQGQSLWIQAAATFATSVVVAKVFGQKPPKMQDNGVRQQVPPATVNSLPIIYGDAFLGGTYVDAALSQDQKVMYHVLALSSISPNGQFSYDQTKFYYGDRLITFDAVDKTKVISLTDGSGNVDTKIKDNLYIYLYKSTANGVITSTNGAPAPSVVMEYNALDKKTVPANVAWPASGRQMNGLAFAIVKLVYSVSSNTTSMSPVTFHCSHYLNNQGVAKPGDVWYDYLTNELYGGAVDPSLVDAASATALNTYSDQLITFTNNQGQPSTQPRYRINGALDTGTNVIQNIDKLLECCDSWMAYNAALGKWSIVINKAQPATLDFNDENIIGDIAVSTVDINQSINQIEAKFPNKLNKDVPDYVFIETPSYLLYPNEPINKYTTEFPLTNDSVQAQYLANRILEQAREDLVVSINTTYYGIQANAGDVVSITNSTYGWTEKLFRVMKVTEAMLPDGSLGASLNLNEYNAQVYDNKPITQFQPTGNNDLPNIMFFGTLNAPVVTDQQPNAAIPTFSVQVTIPSNGQVTMVRLYYTTVATPTDSDWVLWGFQTTPTATPYVPNSTLKFVHIGLPTGTYYFGFNVSNEIGESDISPLSIPYTWLPNPSSSAVAGTFIATFSPATLSVPYDNGTPTFTGVIPQLYGTTAGGSVDFIGAQTDSDPLFINNTWRIGGSATTGYADIIQNGITIGNPTDGGFYALWSAPTAMPDNPATLEVPVRYKSTDGTVVQGATAILQFVYAIKGDNGDPGEPANQNGVAYLYQWSTATPNNPNGFSTFIWETVENTNYVGGNGWSTTIPTNPGTPNIKLWQASKGVTDLATATTTEVDWAEGYSVNDITQNGGAGAQTAYATVYKWDATIPSGPTGTSTYTWASGEVSPIPSGWSASPSTASIPGYTLYEARVYLLDSTTVSTTLVNWALSSISAVGYAGVSGSSARVCFARVSGNPTPTSGTITTEGNSSFPSSAQSTTTWGFAATWGATDPNPSSNNSLYQSDGVYDPASNQTVWSTPYISSLKVGELSAISVNTGGLTVSNFIQGGSFPSVSGSTMNGTGFVFNSGGSFAIGNSSKNLSFNGSTLTMNGDLVVTGNIQADAITKRYTGILPNTIPMYNQGINAYTTVLGTFTAENAGKLAVWVTLTYYNNGTVNNYRAQPLVQVNGQSFANFPPILRMDSGSSQSNLFPIGPELKTSGSCLSYTLNLEYAVTAGQSVTVRVLTSINDNQTTVALLDGSFVALLFQR